MGWDSTSGRSCVSAVDQSGGRALQRCRPAGQRSATRSCIPRSPTRRPAGRPSGHQAAGRPTSDPLAHQTAGRSWHRRQRRAIQAASQPHRRRSGVWVCSAARRSSGDHSETGLIKGRVMSHGFWPRNPARRAPSTAGCSHRKEPTSSGGSVCSEFCRPNNKLFVSTRGKI